MEDSRSLGSGSASASRTRPARPESSNSAHTRMTPTSSTNSSSAHLPRLSGSSKTGGASLLQERLRERKVESARQNSRRRSIEFNGDRDVQSSPIKGPSREREERRPSSSGISSGKGMGVKQIEEQVSTLHKQNFDLKLELYHRRQRQEALERQLEAAERQIEEQAELQEVNDQLLAELEKRDQAVEEAVGIIVTLEEKVERLMREREGVRAIEVDYEPTYFRPAHSSDPPSSPPQVENAKLQPRISIARMPSFLSEDTEGADALRSLYLPSESTLPKLKEESQDGDPDRMDSPRLSVLSESSFMSVYGEKPLKLGVPEIEEPEPELPKRLRSAASVEKWIDERPISAVNPGRITSKGAGLTKSEFLSINDVLESPLQRLEKLKHTLEKANGSHVSHQPRLKERRRAKDIVRRVMKNEDSFEQQHPLPPTPDTISTRTLRHYKGSNEALTDHRMASGTLLNSTMTIPSPRRYASDLSLRPRSAGETVTSRREGHGWDTDTQATFTETGSISSTGSMRTYNGGLFQHPPKRAITPELFTFGNTNTGWGRDVMFNNEPELPVHKPARRIRRSSTPDHPQSDSTVVSYRPFDLSSDAKPYPPDRRSSLAAPTKLKKTAPASQPPTTTVITSPQDSKKFTNRFTNRFFNRSEQQSPDSPKRPNTSSNDPSVVAAEEDSRRTATPPPIKRNRPPVVETTAGRFEDSEQEVKEDVVAADVDGSGNTGGKKWFGLMGRNNSMRNRN